MCVPALFEDAVPVLPQARLRRRELDILYHLMSYYIILHYIMLYMRASSWCIRVGARARVMEEEESERGEEVAT